MSEMVELIRETLAEGMARWTGGANITDDDIAQFRGMPSVGYHAERLAAALEPSREKNNDSN